MAIKPGSVIVTKTPVAQVIICEELWGSFVEIKNISTRARRNNRLSVARAYLQRRPFLCRRSKANEQAFQISSAEALT